MAPMEIWPVTAAELGGPVPGRRAPEVGARVRVGGAVPGAAGPGALRRVRVSFAANVDGPWEHCDESEIAAELARLGRYVALVRKAGVDCALEELTAVEAYVHGAAAAALWTVGLVDRAPLRTGPLVVSDRAVAEQFALAEQLGADTDRLRCNFASGVAAWLSWLTGQWPCMEYPGA